MTYVVKAAAAAAAAMAENRRHVQQIELPASALRYTCG